MTRPGRSSFHRGLWLAGLLLARGLVVPVIGLIAVVVVAVSPTGP